MIEYSKYTQTRLRLYLILAFASIILLFFSIWQISPVVVDPTDIFGLASHLTVSYWVGLALILICSIFVFLDKKHICDAMFVFLLIVIGLFLFGITVFSQECPRSDGSYYPSAMANSIIEYQHIDISEPGPQYNSWPGLPIAAATILEITGVNLYEVIRYFPLFWLLGFILITFSIGKRLNLPPNLAFLLSFIALSSYWLLWSRFDPPSVAFLLFLQCFMLLIVPRNTPAGFILVILTFSGLVIMHSITSVVILLSLITLSIYKKDLRLILLFVVLFFSWYMFLAVGMFQHGVTNWWSAPWRQILLMTNQVENIGGVAPISRMILRYSQLAYPLLYGICFLICLAIIWKRKVRGTDDKLIFSCIFWLIGILGLSVTVPTGAAFGSDLLGRLYMYGFIIVACIIVLGLKNQRILVTIMILFVALNIPAHYGAEAAYGQVLTTDLYGAKFFAQRIKPQEPYFYNGSDTVKLVYFYDPKLIAVQIFTPEQSFSSPVQMDTTILNKVKYAVHGKLGANRMLWAYGHDAMKEWLNNEAGEEFTPIYDNGDYQIYINNVIN